MAAHQTSDAIKTATIAWTRVHAIIKSGTCANDNLSDRDRRAHRSPRGTTRSARSSSHFDQGFIAIFTDRMAGGGLSSRSRSDGHGEARSSSLREDTWSVRFPSDGVEDSWKNTTIAVQSNRDRSAIEPRSWILHRGIDSTIFRRRPRWITITIKPRSWPDRGAIVARSWCDRGFF